jgi:hypothetical protein
MLSGRTVAELLATEAPFAPIAQPGEKWSYSNCGYNLPSVGRRTGDRTGLEHSAGEAHRRTAWARVRRFGGFFGGEGSFAGYESAAMYSGSRSRPTSGAEASSGTRGLSVLDQARAKLDYEASVEAAHMPPETALAKRTRIPA